jgi:hypothetical protein
VSTTTLLPTELPFSVIDVHFLSIFCSFFGYGFLRGSITTARAVLRTLGYKTLRQHSRTFAFIRGSLCFP